MLDIFQIEGQGGYDEILLLSSCAKELIIVIRSSPFASRNLLLWDLTDERLGVIETVPKCFLTRSTKGMAAGLYE